MHRPSDQRLTDRTYSLSEAARFADAPPDRIRGWFRADRGAGGAEPSVFDDCRRGENEPLQLSFLELAEVAVANHLHRNGWSNAKLAELRWSAARQLSALHPLATRQAQQLVAASSIASGSPTSSERLCSTLNDIFDYDQLNEPGWVVRYFPRGHHGHLVIEPGFGSGRVTMISHNLLADVVAGRHFGGDPIDFIAQDYELSEDAVRAAIAYAEPRS